MWYPFELDFANLGTCPVPEGNLENLANYQWLALGYKVDLRFRAYWDGAIKDDDQAFMDYLAVWCNGDKWLMDDAFSDSPYVAAKNPWDEYVNKCRTFNYSLIANALAKVTMTARDRYEQCITGRLESPITREETV